MRGFNCVLIFSGDQKQILFVKRTTEPYLGKYNLPGGKIEPGEDGFAAAYRELYEETGIGRGDVTLSHMMDFTYYNQDCYVEVYAGALNGPVDLRPEKHPLSWLSPSAEELFALQRFAGEGNIGHMLLQWRLYGPGSPDALK